MLSMSTSGHKKKKLDQIAALCKGEAALLAPTAGWPWSPLAAGVGRDPKRTIQLSRNT